MERRIKRVGIALFICFAMVFLQLNNIQVRESDALAKNPLNSIGTLSSFVQPRGEIITADGKVLAYSKSVGGTYHYQRVYPPLTAEMFSSVTGYYATAVEADPFGVESYYDKYLSQHESPITSLHDLLTQHLETDDVVLTLSERLQAIAMQSLDASAGANGGAVVALDPRDGDILAMYSDPTYNPNMLSQLNPKAVNAVADGFNSRPNNLNPLFNNAIEATHPPGSTFKVITTAAIFDHKPSIATQTFPVETTYSFPNSGSPPKTLHNYAFGECGGDLAHILAYSCDTSYSQVGDELGAENLALEARAFGFGQVPPIDLPSAQASHFPPPSAINATTYMAYSAIGQYEDQATALQMALVAAGIADNGTIMAPHVLDKIVGSEGDEVVYKPHPWLQATSASTATEVRKLMTGVTTIPNATAYSLFQGYYSLGLPTIAAKTGTAEPTLNTCGTYNWLIALGPAAPGQVPSVVVAAMVPILSSVACSVNPTGASIAGPVLLPLLEAALKQQGAG